MNSNSGAARESQILVTWPTPSVAMEQQVLLDQFTRIGAVSALMIAGLSVRLRILPIRTQ